MQFEQNYRPNKLKARTALLNNAMIK